MSVPSISKSPGTGRHGRQFRLCGVETELCGRATDEIHKSTMMRKFFSMRIRPPHLEFDSFETPQGLELGVCKRWDKSEPAGDVHEWANCWLTAFRSQSWCPRWQAQDDPGSPSVRFFDFPRSRPRQDDIEKPPNDIREQAWELTWSQRCHHELRRQLRRTEPVHHLRQGYRCPPQQTACRWCR